jgi:adenosine deaminase
VRDRRVPLEMCPTSNVHTGAAASIAEHPFDLLRRLRFRVTVNTDNRLMSGVSVSSEFAALDEAFGLGLGEMEWLTINAMKSAFAPFDERLRLINEVVKPGYAHLRAEASRVALSD